MYSLIVFAWIGLYSRVDLNSWILKICASWMSMWNILENYVLLPENFNWTEIFENHPWSLHLLISASKGVGTRVWSCSFNASPPWFEHRSNGSKCLKNVQLAILHATALYLLHSLKQLFFHKFWWVLYPDNILLVDLNHEMLGPGSMWGLTLFLSELNFL